MCRGKRGLDRNGGREGVRACPRFRVFLDVRPEAGARLDLGIDDRPEFLDEPGLARPVRFRRSASNCSVSKISKSDNTPALPCLGVARTLVQARQKFLVAEDFGHFGVVHELGLADALEGGRLDEVRQGSVLGLRRLRNTR